MHSRSGSPGRAAMRRSNQIEFANLRNFFKYDIDEGDIAGGS
ncbi:MAG: hypothetical protein OJF51_002566 [Nitrospira sp.]|nr:MAG: hypothetical protein OJF51_002566 [Nitrospira sp.]